MTIRNHWYLRMVNPFLAILNANRIALAKITNRTSLPTECSNNIGCIVALTPNTKKILKIFDPTMFPMAISGLRFRMATTEVASSGRDVPMATMVRPIVVSESHAIVAMAILHFTIR